VGVGVFFSTHFWSFNFSRMKIKVPLRGGAGGFFFFSKGPPPLFFCFFPLKPPAPQKNLFFAWGKPPGGGGFLFFFLAGEGIFLGEGQGERGGGWGGGPC